MLLRIVRLPLQPEGVAAFLALFEHSRTRIQQQPGCQHLALWQDADQPHTYCTVSHWTDAAALDAYRRSSLFGEVWPATKRLLAAPATAFSLTSPSKTGLPEAPAPATAAQAPPTPCHPRRRGA